MVDLFIDLVALFLFFIYIYIYIYINKTRIYAVYKRPTSDLGTHTD